MADQQTTAPVETPNGDQAGEGESEDNEQLFPIGVLEGDAVTPQAILKKAKNGVKLFAELSKHEVPIGSGGLFDPNKRGRAIVHFLPGKMRDEPVRGGADDTVTEWKKVQKLDIFYAEAASDEATLIRNEMANLARLNQVAAQTLLKELAEIVKDPASA